MKRVKEKISYYNALFKQKGQIIASKIKKFIEKRPLLSFFSLLGIILLLIIIGNIMRKPDLKVEKNGKIPKTVAVYSIGQAPKLLLQAKIEKSGVVKIVSLSSGIVQKIMVTEGQSVYKGQTIIWLSSNYQGAVAPSYARQIAAANYQFLKDNYQSQKDTIAKNREVAEKVESQTADLRDIQNRSIDETKSLISLNEDTISMMDSQISALEAINVNGASNSAILQLKSSKSSALAGLNQARSSLRSLEYQSGGDNEPAQLARLQKEITLKQLDLQEKTLDLNKEIARLNLRLSEIQESLMYPGAPYEGVVERIFVKPGQLVQPGQQLVSMVGSVQTIKAIVSAPSSITGKISLVEPSLMQFASNTVSLYPSYISQEPVNGSLHVVIFNIPTEYNEQVKNDQIASISIPIGGSQTFASLPYVPIDALYQTQNEGFLFVIRNKQNKKIAESKSVVVGNAYGSYVEIVKGLSSGDQVILDRNIIEGDEVVIRP